MLLAGVISAIAFFAVFASVLGLCLWWRLRHLDRCVYRLGWDIDALAGALSRGEGYETSEHPDN